MSHSPQPLDPTLPPPAGAAAETLAPPADAAPPATGADAPPGYEFIRELGRGGMGVVYLARDIKLNRPVALKMILAGAHAMPASLVRFLAEAEAVAALTHPGIVAIYEIGRHAGLPYFTLEYCPGGSLAEKVKDAPLPPREAAAVVEQVARAVAHAHGQGIVHRDLKPENILRASHGACPRGADSEPRGQAPWLADGVVPKVTDFGLAKRLESESGLTHTGAVMGTPSYMAPEQAEGKKEVGAAADVYALGAILYRLLGGRPPFQAATPLDTMLQVVGEEPVPLRQLNRQVPRDLETITHKCLAKGPAKRYVSAEALADDLRRWLAGEPIQARPVGRVERGLKWVKRHPAGAGFLAALLLGVALSTTLAIQADANARRARKNEQSAYESAHELARANTELTRRGDELAKSRESLLATAARGLLRPLRGEPGPLSQQEVTALADLAGERDDELRLRFVQEALGERKRAIFGLRHRSAVGLQAAVGLDERRRAAVEDLLVGRLRAAPAQWRDEDIATLLTDLGGLNSEARVVAGHTFIDAFTRVNGPEASRPLATGLANLVSQCSSEEALQLGLALVRLQRGRLDHFTQYELDRQFERLVTRLDPPQAAILGDEMLKALQVEKAPVQQLAGMLVKVTERLAPSDAVTVLNKAVQLLPAGDREGRVAQVPPLPWQAQQEVKTQSGIAKELKRAQRRASIALGPREAVAVREQARNELREAIRSRRELHEARELIRLAALEPQDAQQLAADVVRAIADEKATDRLPILADPLIALLTGVPAAPEKALLAPVVSRVVRLLDDESAVVRHIELVAGLGQLQEWLGPAEARAIAEALAAAANRSKPFDKSLSLRPSLLAMTCAYLPRMEVNEAAALCARLLPQMAQEIEENPAGLNQRIMWRLVVAVVTAPVRAQLAMRLAQAIGRTADNEKALALIDHFAPMIEGMITADRASTNAAGLVSRSLASTRSPEARRKLAEQLVKLAKGLAPEQGAQLLAAAIRGCPDDRVQFILARALVAATRTIKPDKAIDHLLSGLQPAAGAAPSGWSWFVGETAGPPAAGPNSRHLLMLALSEPTRTADLTRVRVAVQRFVDVTEVTEEMFGIVELMDSLPEGLKRLDREQAANLFIQSIHKNRNPVALASYVGGLLWAIHDMDEAKAGEFRNRALAAFDVTAERMKGNAIGAQLIPICRAMLRDGDMFEKKLPRPGAAPSTKQFNVLPSDRPLDVSLLVSRLDDKTDPDQVEVLIEQAALRVTKLSPREQANSYAKALIGCKNQTATLLLIQRVKILAPELTARDAKELLPLIGSLIPSTTDPARQRQLFEALAAVATKLDLEDAPLVFLGWLADTTDSQARAQLVSALQNTLTRIESEERRRRSAAVASLASGATTLANALGAVAARPVITEPLPCGLETPELVELLKHPLCVGPARRVILDQLEVRYARKFADPWEFVRFAQERKLGLDFTSSPKRVFADLVKSVSD